MTITVLNTKNSKVESKIPDTSSLVTTTVFNKNICQVDNKNPDHAKYINTQEFNTFKFKIHLNYNLI